MHRLYTKILAIFNAFTERKGCKLLHLADKFHKLNFRQLMTVYEEGNLENAREFFAHLPREQWLLQAEQAFYQYLTEGFFTTPGAVYAIWVENGEYVSALRLEPYQDGLLLEALETAPNHRRKGYGEMLIRAVLEAFPEKIYSHVSKRNRPSLAIHQKCGFVEILDYARYIDGSVAHNAVTLCYR